MEVLEERQGGLGVEGNADGVGRHLQACGLRRPLATRTIVRDINSRAFEVAVGVGEDE